MTLRVFAKHSQVPSSDVLILPFWQGKKAASAACDADDFSSWISEPLDMGDFLGKEGETLMLYRAKGKQKRILLLGLGKPSTDDDQIRRSYASAVLCLRKKKLTSAMVFLPVSGRTKASPTAVYEGVLLANYSFDILKGAASEDRATLLEEIYFVGGSAEELQRAETVVAAVNWTRDLVNGNADDVHVDALAAFARGLEEEFKTVTTTILGKAELEKEGLGFILAVNRGAARDPALILLEYRGDPSSKKKIAVVGKGITFDTGGINLKTGAGSHIETMKADMAGTGAVLGLIRAAAALKLKRNIVGVLAIAENAIGPKSYKPGDVIRGYAGKTVEVNNTDAEGRLVLADALAYVQKKYSPTHVIDLATLTGGVSIALGEAAAGLMSNDDELSKALIRSGERTHERVWRLPLFPEYKELLKSQIADLQNSGGRLASSSTGGMFLLQFIEDDLPWAHLDIAGTAYLSKARGYHTTPATGIGVRLLIDFLEHTHGR